MPHSEISNEALIAENQRLKEELESLKKTQRLDHKYKELVNSLGEIVLIAQDGRIAYCNRKTSQFFGKDDVTLSHVPFTEFIYPDDRDMVLDNYIKRMSDPSYTKTYPFRLINRNGEAHWVKISAVHIEWQERPATLNILTDINERVAMEEQLNEAKERAEEAAAKEAAFLANMSHEIRTPMNGVLGMTHLLLDTPINDLQRHYLTTVEQSSQYLLRVINDILDFSSMEAGKLSIFNEPFNLLEALHQLKNSFSYWAFDKKLEFACLFSDRIPTFVRGDQTRIKQVLTNLLSNAIKFTERGSITFSAEYEEQILTIKVKDTGMGIPEEMQEHIFDSFAQVDDPQSRAKEGTGLGLAISKQLVELMKGTLTLESMPDFGTTFTVKLPLIEDTGAVQISQQLTVHKEYNLHILVVEDNDVNYLVVQKFLEKLSCTTNRAPDGFSAIEQVNKNEYDLIFMDVQMPGIDGYETTRRILELLEKENKSPIPIIAMTANAMRSDEELCLKAGMDRYVSKPIEFHKLLSIVDHYAKVKEKQA